MAGIAGFNAQRFASHNALVTFVQTSVTTIYAIFCPSDGTNFWVLFYA